MTPDRRRAEACALAEYYQAGRAGPDLHDPDAAIRLAAAYQADLDVKSDRLVAGLDARIAYLVELVKHTTGFERLLQQDLAAAERAAPQPPSKPARREGGPT